MNILLKMPVLGHYHDILPFLLLEILEMEASKHQDTTKKFLLSDNCYTKATQKRQIASERLGGISTTEWETHTHTHTHL
jgi:hypothetical protein